MCVHVFVPRDAIRSFVILFLDFAVLGVNANKNVFDTLC